MKNYLLTKAMIFEKKFKKIARAQKKSALQPNYEFHNTTFSLLLDLALLLSLCHLLQSTQNKHLDEFTAHFLQISLFSFLLEFLK